jgi:actin-related protein
MLWVGMKSLGCLTAMLCKYAAPTFCRDERLWYLKLGPERFRAPEILFNPEIIGQEDAGVHQVVVDSINRVDLDLRKSLFSNIVLSGGSTLCRGRFYPLPLCI